MVEEQKNHNKVVVDDVEYAYDDMSENCKNQLKGVQAADRELARLNIAIALTKTARIAYMEAFTNDLPGAVTGEPLEDVGDD